MHSRALGSLIKDLERYAEESKQRKLEESEQRELLEKLVEENEYALVTIKDTLHQIDCRFYPLVAEPTSYENLRRFFLQNKEEELEKAEREVEKLQEEIHLLNITIEGE